MDTQIWVDIETTKSTDGLWTLKGQIQKTVFDGVISNQLTKGYIKLEKVYWTSSTYDEYGNPQGEKLTEYGGHGKLKDYLGDMYLKVEHIVSVSPIDGEAELARFKKAEEKHLSVVSPIKP